MFNVNKENAMFYVTDVETLSTVPTNGALLSVGMVAVNEDAEIVDRLYMRLGYDINTRSESTYEWWSKQEDDAVREAFDWSLDRLSSISAASKIHKFVASLSEKDSSFFVANPASFDYPWIQMLFETTNVDLPFSHRTLCLRSMRYGKYGGTFGEKRGEFHNPKIPHHAFWDAEAEAADLISMLKDNLE